jgi:hypothetical protein
MREFKRVLLTAIACAGLVAAAPKAQAQVSVSIGPEPVCPYGYYDVAPYACAPEGYYGPEWFVNGAFIGVGPWFHGPEHFNGWVDNRFHPEHGYHGPMPHRGEHHPEGWHVDASHFHGNEMRDGHGHAVDHKR